MVVVVPSFQCQKSRRLHVREYHGLLQNLYHMLQGEGYNSDGWKRLTQGTENNNHRHIHPNVGQSHANLVSLWLTATCLIVHLHVDGARRTSAVFHVGSALDNPGVPARPSVFQIKILEFCACNWLVRLLLPKAVHMVIRHAFLCNNNFLRTIDYKISSLIVYALTKLTELFVWFIG